MLGSLEEAWHLGDPSQNRMRKGASTRAVESGGAGTPLPFAAYLVILGKSLDLSEPQFPIHGMRIQGRFLRGLGEMTLACRGTLGATPSFPLLLSMDLLH